jgi:hypothetical protein
MKKVTALVIALFPMLALAQAGTLVVKDVNSLSAKLLGIGNIVIYLLISLAVIFIVWNVVMFLIKGGDPAAKHTALANIGYGVLGLAIIVSIWGLVNILTGTFITSPTINAGPNLGNNVSNGGMPVNQAPLAP